MMLHSDLLKGQENWVKMSHSEWRESKLLVLHLQFLVTLGPGGTVGTGEAKMALQHPDF